MCGALTDVCFGSKADMCGARDDVRFTPVSNRKSDAAKRSRFFGAQIAYSIDYATGLDKSGPALALQAFQNVRETWWAHKDSNLGPAD
jgi:hypothetical protein